MLTLVLLLALILPAHATVWWQDRPPPLIYGEKQTPLPKPRPTAMAQGHMLPTTVPLVNNTSKEKIGTATIWGNRMVLRYTDGTFIATVVVERDGKSTLYDENGKVMDQIPGNIKIPEAK
jgi:hypothetical protein